MPSSARESRTSARVEVCWKCMSISWTSSKKRLKEIGAFFCLHLSTVFQFQLTLTGENASPVLKRNLECIQVLLDEVDASSCDVDRYQKRIGEKIKKYKKAESNIQESLKKITEFEHLVEYYRVLHDIQDISAELTSCIHSKDEQKIVNLFLSLSGSPESSDSVIGRLQEVDASHMKLYARRMALFWYEVIKDKLSRWVNQYRIQVTESVCQTFFKFVPFSRIGTNFLKLKFSIDNICFQF